MIIAVDKTQKEGHLIIVGHEEVIMGVMYLKVSERHPNLIMYADGQQLAFA